MKGVWHLSWDHIRRKAVRQLLANVQRRCRRSSTAAATTAKGAAAAVAAAAKRPADATAAAAGAVKRRIAAGRCARKVMTEHTGRRLRRWRLMRLLVAVRQGDRIHPAETVGLPILRVLVL